MKILPKDPSPNITEYVKQVNQKQKSDAPSESGAKPVDKADTVKISQEARALQEAKEILKELPDDQPKKVAMLKNQIENGTYTINSTKLAENMVRELLINALL